MRKYKDKPPYTPTNHDHEYECLTCDDYYEITETHTDKEFCSYECREGINMSILELSEGQKVYRERFSE